MKAITDRRRTQIECVCFFFPCVLSVAGPGSCALFVRMFLSNGLLLEICTLVFFFLFIHIPSARGHSVAFSHLSTVH